MKTILVVNPKGGCGKSTLSTNLASYYALWKLPVALIAYDPQRSSLEWLAQRDRSLGAIQGIDASVARREPSVSAGIQRLVMDVPARIERPQLRRLFKFADCVVIPVLPSPIDIRAAGHFIADLMLHGMLKQSRVGLVANRVRENTVIYHNLERFLGKMRIPLITHFRDTQNYIHAADSGVGVFEMPPYRVMKEIDQWRPLIHWIEKG
ncbi:MAG: AAA family ATPase [bacterium]